MTRNELGALIGIGGLGRVLPHPEAQPFPTTQDKMQLLGLARLTPGASTPATPTNESAIYVTLLRRRRR
jgi:hypothetical protein